MPEICTIMTFKSFMNETKAGFIIKNLLIALAIGIVLLVILLSYLKRYTEHGVEVEVPNITGMYLEEAQTILTHEGLQMEVVDSTFSKKVPLGTIVEQTPVPNSHCKHGRSIYVARACAKCPYPIYMISVSARQKRLCVR